MEELEELVQQGKEEKETKLRIESEATMKLNLTVDEVIEEYVGSFGFSQLLHVFFVSLAWMFDSQNTLVTIFSDAEPLWTCKGNGSWCDRGLTGSVCGLDPGAWEWVGGKESSTIAEWGLVCDHRFRAGIPASLFFLGSLLGSAIYGRLADSYLGRKKTVLLSCLLTSVTTFLTSLSPNVWIYAFFRFTNGFSRSGIGICCLVLSTEVLGRKWRGQVGQYSFFFFTAGFLSLPLLAYPNRTSWRNMYKILSLLPLLYSLLVLPFICESPRWLVIKGRTKEALEVLNKLATLNGKKLPNNLSLSISATTKITEPNLSMDIWSTTWATRRMITVMFAGLGVGFVYYGVQLNVENLHFNLYFTVAINAMMEIPAVFVGGVLLSFTNRRLLFSLSAYTAGVSCILCILFFGKNNTSGKGKNEQSGSWPQLIVEAIGFMGAATAFDVLYIYCLELFPTNVRNYAVSLLRQALMLGASMAPLLVVLGRLSPSLSFLIFGVLAIFSGFSSFWLPETRNAPLYETLEQQEEEEEKQTSTSESRLELGEQ